MTYLDVQWRHLCTCHLLTPRRYPASVKEVLFGRTPFVQTARRCCSKPREATVPQGIIIFLAQRINKNNDNNNGPWQRTKKAVGKEGDGDTSCIWCTWNGPKRLKKRTGRTGRIEIILITLLKIARIFRKVLETRGDCCHVTSSERLRANTGVKKLVSSEIIMIIIINSKCWLFVDRNETINNIKSECSKLA